MALTNVQAYVDKGEYSRYEVEKDTITLRIVPTPSSGIDGESVTIQIFKARRGRNAVVYTTTYTFSTSDYSRGATTEIELNNIIDDDGLNLMRHGSYFIRVTDATDTDVTDDTNDFYVSFVSVENLKNNELFGVPLESYEVRMPLYQPVNITGVEIKTVSRNHPLQSYDLVFERTANNVCFLNWSNGYKMPLHPTQKSEYVLRGGLKYSGMNSGYLIVEVDPWELPSSAGIVRDEIVIDRKILPDELIRDHLKSAKDYMEKVGIGIYMEPTRIVTDIDDDAIDLTRTTVLPLDEDYDEKKNPLTYYQNSYWSKWINVLFPFRPLLRVNTLTGMVGPTSTLTVNNDWVQINESDGFVQLVPIYGSYEGTAVGLFYIVRKYANYEIPNFWHYSIDAGLRDASHDTRLHYVVRLKAAVGLLSIAGTAYRSGISSESVSRDGIVTAVSYTSSAIYGIYSAPINDMKDILKSEMKKLRNRYGAIQISAV